MTIRGAVGGEMAGWQALEYGDEPEGVDVIQAIEGSTGWSHLPLCTSMRNYTIRFPEKFINRK